MAPKSRDDDTGDRNYLPQRDGTGELRLAWGNWSVGVRGPLVTTVVLIVALGVGMFYMNYLNVIAHGELLKAMLMQTCLSSLTSDEKIALREAARKDLKAWNDLLHYNCFYLRSMEPK